MWLVNRLAGRKTLTKLIIKLTSQSAVATMTPNYCKFYNFFTHFHSKLHVYQLQKSLLK
jgi:hypothetical protein